LIFLELAERPLHFLTPAPPQATNSASGMSLFLAKTQKIQPRISQHIRKLITFIAVFELYYLLFDIIFTYLTINYIR